MLVSIASVNVLIVFQSVISFKLCIIEKIESQVSFFYNALNWLQLKCLVREAV